MYSLDIYQPLLSHVAHLLRAFPGGEDRFGTAGRDTPTAPAEECVRLIARAENEAAARLGERAEEFRFPVHAWLAEKLPALSFGGEIHKTLPPLPENAAALFKSRLDALILNIAAGNASAHENELFRLYVVCLELGYGERSDPAAEEKRRRYLRVCRNVMARRAAPKTAEKTGRFSRLSKRAAVAVLLAPPAATGALYCVYRVWLHALFIGVLG